ncbi:MAG: YheC/YheD family protein [Ectobacillus sp.]
MFSTATVKIICDNSCPTAEEIKISKQLAGQWNIKKDGTFTIFFGLTSVHVNITSIEEKGAAIKCSPVLLSRLKLPGDCTLRYSWLASRQELFLGPVIAVITEIKDCNPPSFGTISEFCGELAMLCEQSGSFFYVTSLSLWTEQTIYGYFYNHGEWVKEEMPFPSVVHNRIHSRKTEQSSKFQEWLQILKNCGIPHFNDRFLNKWEVYETLQQFPYLNPYIPHTFLFTSKEVLEQALSQYACVFLKPVYGSQGRHIFKVTKADGGFLLDYTTFQGDIHRTYSSLDKLFATLKNHIKQRPYIIQQGLALYTYCNSPVDFRILCHKTDAATWKATSAVARVSSKNQFVSNIAMGGNLYKPEEVLLSSFEAKQVKHMKKLLAELAVETAKCISQSYDGLYGEFGMDLAFDKEGNLWLIEVNTKPSKSIQQNPASSSIRPSVRSILQCCDLVAQQPVRRK